MSTGLTWVVCVDNDQNEAPSMSWVQSFNDYDDAKNFAIYTQRIVQLTGGGSKNIVFEVYTTSPNQVGYVNADVPPVFVPYE